MMSNKTAYEPSRLPPEENPIEKIAKQRQVRIKRAKKLGFETSAYDLSGRGSG
jgi:hypothetical protein